MATDGLFDFGHLQLQIKLAKNTHFCPSDRLTDAEKIAPHARFFTAGGSPSGCEKRRTI